VVHCRDILTVCCSICKYGRSQCFRVFKGFFTSSTVRQHAGNANYFANPATVILVLCFNT